MSQEQIERVILVHLRRRSLKYTGTTLDTRERLGFTRRHI
jgi:hypothetical protein